jgi:hypothetical protein
MSPRDQIIHPVHPYRWGGSSYRRCLVLDHRPADQSLQICERERVLDARTIRSLTTASYFRQRRALFLIGTRTETKIAVNCLQFKRLPFSHRYGFAVFSKPVQPLFRKTDKFTKQDFQHHFEKDNSGRHAAATFTSRTAVLDFAKRSYSKKKIPRDCRSVELRALCNDSPQTPPGPEGSNGSGSVSCAAEYPKFLFSRPGASLTLHEL